MCASTHICVYLTCVFAFLIHSHNCAFCGILLHNKNQDKSLFLQMLLKGYLHRQTNRQYIFSFALFLDPAVQSNHWTNENQVWIFIFLVLQVISKCLGGENVFVGVSFAMKYILAFQIWTMLASELELCCFQQDMWQVSTISILYCRFSANQW